MERFVKLDIFGSTVALTHNNQKKYKTRLGASFTIIFIIGILIVALQGLTQIVTGQIKSISTEVRHFDEDKYPEGVDMTERGFKFAFGFEEQMDPTLGRFEISHIS